MKKVVMLLLLLWICLPFAGAALDWEEQKKTEMGTLMDAMPDERQVYLDGIEPQMADGMMDSFLRLLDNVSKDSRSVLQNGIQGLLRVAVVIVLTAVARGFSAAAGGEADTLIDLAGAVGCAAVLLKDFSGVLSLCRDTLAQISLFSATLQPVLAAVLSVGGNAATATTLQVATMLVFDMVIRLVNRLLVPAVCGYLAIIAVDAAAGNAMLRGIADGIKNITSGALKLILTVFTAYLTIAGGVSGSVDRVALKTAKFAVSGAVPVVGGVISDATETVLSGAALLRGSIGIFGMLCVTAICIVPFLRAGVSYLCYKAGAGVLSPLCSSSLRQMLDGVGTGFGMLLGMLSTCCLILYLELVYVVAMVKPI